MSSWAKIGLNRFAEDDATPPPTYKTSMPASGVANTKGAYVTVVASVPFDTAGLLVTFQLDQSIPYLVDIAVGTVGNEIAVFPNLALYGAGLTSHTVQMRFLPLKIRAGVRISARFQATSGAPSIAAIKMQLLAQSIAGIESPERWEDWGTDLANSTGTVVTGSGTPNAKGSFSQLVAAAARDTRWFLFAILTGSIDDEAIDFAIGTQPKLSDIYTTNEFNGLWAYLPWSVPKGSQVQARVACGGGANSVTLIGYGGG